MFYYLFTYLAFFFQMSWDILVVFLFSILFLLNARFRYNMHFIIKTRCIIKGKKNFENVFFFV